MYNQQKRFQTLQMPRLEKHKLVSRKYTVGKRVESVSQRAGIKYKIDHLLATVKQQHVGHLRLGGGLRRL